MLQRRKSEKSKDLIKRKSLASLQKQLILHCNGILAQVGKVRDKARTLNPCLKPNLNIMVKSSSHKFQSACSTATCSPSFYQVPNVTENPFQIFKKQIYFKHQRKQSETNLRKLTERPQFNNVFYDLKIFSQKQQDKKQLQANKFPNNSKIKKSATQQKQFQNNWLNINRTLRNRKKVLKSSKKNEKSKFSRPWTSIQYSKPNPIQKENKCGSKLDLIQPAPLFILEESESSIFNPWDVESAQSFRIEH